MDAFNNNNEANNIYTASEIGVEDYLKCALCGQDLKFSHQFDYMNLSVKEEAQCQCCQIKLKSREHRLQ